MNQNSTPAWNRILVKLSGEALLGGADYGIDPAVLKRIASDVGQVQSLGVQIGIVIAATCFAARAWRAPAWIASPPTRWGCWRQS